MNDSSQWYPVRVAAVFTMAIFLLGNDACRENYFLASQAAVSPSATETATPSSSASVSPSASASPTISFPSASVSVSASAKGTPEEARFRPITTAATDGWLGDLSNALTGSSSADRLLAAKKSAAGSARMDAGNWLGEAFKDKEVGGQAVDADNDGFADVLEEQVGSDPRDPRSTPRNPRSSLARRMASFDSDMDGVSDNDELPQGTDPKKKDTDGDGATDFAEGLSMSNPKDINSIPRDYDGDGLSDDFELKAGLRIDNPDTDGDGLDDTEELAIGSDPRRNDTDHDGVLDGKEFSVGSDPTIPDAY